LIVGSVDAMGGSYADQAGVIQKEAKKKVTYLRYADAGANTLSFGPHRQHEILVGPIAELQDGRRHQ
jgi:hypothetical protein